MAATKSRERKRSEEPSKSEEAPSEFDISSSKDTALSVQPVATEKSPVEGEVGAPARGGRYKLVDGKRVPVED